VERLRGLGSAGIGQLWLKWVVRRARDESPLLSPPGFRVNAVNFGVVAGQCVFGWKWLR
jgi:hypothetical protein